MFKSMQIFCIIFISLSHCTTCNERDDEIKEHISIISPYLGSCSQYFQYKRIDEFINGNLTLTNMREGDKVTLVFKTGQIFRSSLKEKDDGILLPDGSSEDIVNRVRSGQPISYRVDFPQGYAFPLCVKISVNDRELCTGVDYYAWDREFILEHTMEIINNSVSVFTNNINIPSFAESPSCGLADTKVTIDGMSPLTYALTEMSRIRHPWVSVINMRQASLMTRAMTSPRTLCSRNHDCSGSCEGKSGDVLLRNRNGCWIPESVIAAGLILQQCSNPLQQNINNCVAARHISRLENYIAQLEQPVIGSLEDICGRSGTQPRSKHPWLVVVYYKMITGVVYLCSGILISSRSILLPAPCINHKKMIPEIKIYLGRHDLNSTEEIGVVTRDIAEITLHQNFEYNGLVLVQMNAPVRFTQYVTPICLGSEATDEQMRIREQNATLTGWNYKGVHMNNMTFPQTKEVNYASVQQCHRNEYPPLQYLCVSSHEELDMLIIQRNQRWLLHGVYSGLYNIVSGTGGYFIKVSDWRSWILGNML